MTFRKFLIFKNLEKLIACIRPQLSVPDFSVDLDFALSIGPFVKLFGHFQVEYIDLHSADFLEFFMLPITSKS